MKGTIQALDRKQGKKGPYWRLQIDGRWGTVWKAPPDGFYKGQQVDYEAVQKGDFLNFTICSPDNGDDGGSAPPGQPSQNTPGARRPSPPTGGTGGSFGRSDGSERLIVRECALKAAVEFFAGRKKDADQVLEVAGEFAQWILSHECECKPEQQAAGNSLAEPEPEPVKKANTTEIGQRAKTLGLDEAQLDALTKKHFGFAVADMTPDLLEKLGLILTLLQLGKQEAPTATVAEIGQKWHKAFNDAYKVKSMWAASVQQLKQQAEGLMGTKGASDEVPF